MATERDEGLASRGAEPAPAAAKDASKTDRLYVHSRTARGDGFVVLRSREERLELAELRNMRHGQSIHGEVVRLHPLEGQERTFDVEVLADTRETAQAGPARVATAAYRRNWEAIFGGHEPDVDPGELN
jgi:hypothetical protein